MTARPYKISHVLVVKEDRVKLAIVDREERRGKLYPPTYHNEIFLYRRTGQSIAELKTLAEEILLRRFAEQKYGTEDGRDRVVYLVETADQIEQFQK